MNAPKPGQKSQPFPRKRPEVTIAPSRAKLFGLRSRLLPGWGVPLEPGRSGWMAWYDPPGWGLTSVSYMPATRLAEVHGVEGVEIPMLDWEPPEARWREGYTHVARLTDTAVQWLATSHVRKGSRVLRTFMDDGFESDWGESSRVLEDTGRLVDDDGGFRIAGGPDKTVHDVLAQGMFRVTVGERRFTCLRVIDLRTGVGGSGQLEREILSESFYTRRDRLVLFRRYNGRLWAIDRAGRGGRPWDEQLPDHARLVIDGAVFVHWYDCLTDVSLALA